MAFCLSREGLRGADYKNQALIESSNAHMLKKNTSTGHYLWHPEFDKVWEKSHKFHCTT